MATLEDMAAKGRRKYSAKIPAMTKSYAAAESRAKDHYGKTPFGPTRKANYSAAWAYMPANYSAIVKPGLEAKWSDNWKAKMAE
jgi:hypothetical protein